MYNRTVLDDIEKRISNSTFSVADVSFFHVAGGFENLFKQDIFFLSAYNVAYTKIIEYIFAFGVIFRLWCIFYYMHMPFVISRYRSGLLNCKMFALYEFHITWVEFKCNSIGEMANSRLFTSYGAIHNTISGIMLSFFSGLTIIVFRCDSRFQGRFFIFLEILRVGELFVRIRYTM